MVGEGELSPGVGEHRSQRRRSPVVARSLGKHLAAQIGQFGHTVHAQGAEGIEEGDVVEDLRVVGSTGGGALQRTAQPGPFGQCRHALFAVAHALDFVACLEAREVGGGSGQAVNKSVERTADEEDAKRHQDEQLAGRELHGATAVTVAPAMRAGLCIT